MNDEYEMKYMPIYKGKDSSERLEKLSDEKLGKVVRNLIRCLHGEEVIDLEDDLLNYLTEDNIRRYETAREYCISRSGNGKKGGRPKSTEKHTKAYGNHTKPTEDGRRKTEDENIKDILSFLNSKTNSHFRDSEKNIQIINARLNEGYTVEDFKKVIEKKVRAWKDDPKMCNFLKPSTLFAVSHFDDYLNEPDELKPNPKVIKPNQFTAGVQKTDYDFAELEKKLVKN